MKKSKKKVKNNSPHDTKVRLDLLFKYIKREIKLMLKAYKEKDDGKMKDKMKGKKKKK